MRSLVFLVCVAAVVSGSEVKLPPVPQILPAPIAPISTVTKDATQRVVCYLGRSKNVRTHIGEISISDIDQRLCTHIIASYIYIDIHGKITIKDVKDQDAATLFADLKNLKKRNIKTLWSWGGWTDDPVALNSLIKTIEVRNLIIKNVVEWIKLNQWDGLDLDLAYQNVLNVNLENQLALMKDLSEALHKNDLMLTMAASANLDIMKNSYKVPEMSSYLDWINLKAFDLTLDSKQCNLLAPLYGDKNNPNTVDAAVKAWLKDVPASKLLLGVPLTGKQFELDDPKKFLPGAAVKGLPKVLDYNQICPLLKGDSWKTKWENLQRVDWAVKDKHWMTWSSIKSITEKAQYVQNMKLGGIVAWGIGRDDYKGICGTKWPLLKSMNSVLRKDGLIITPPLPVPLTGTKAPCNHLGFAPDFKNPTKFYRCILKDKTLTLIGFVCPHTLVFNPMSNVCDYPKNLKKY